INTIFDIEEEEDMDISNNSDDELDDMLNQILDATNGVGQIREKSIQSSHYNIFNFSTLFSDSSYLFCLLFYIINSNLMANLYKIVIAELLNHNEHNAIGDPLRAPYDPSQDYQAQVAITYQSFLRTGSQRAQL
ncbi:1807_t:CDS:2, partial [Gigaspora rosea]